MATEAGEVNVLDELTESIAERVAKRTADAAKKIPDVYTSGMRGAEKPPHIREAEERDKKAKAVAAKKKKDEADGKATVTFRAKPTVSNKEKIAALEKEVADMKAAASKDEKTGSGKFKKVKIA